MALFLLSLACVYACGCSSGLGSQSETSSLTRATLDRYEFTQVHMGVPVRIMLYAESEEIARNAARAGFAAIARIDDIASDWRVDSELMRVNARAGTGPVPISEELYDMLAMSQQIAQASHGAFDCTIGPVSRFWREVIQSGDTSDHAIDFHALGDARTLVGMHMMTLDASARTVSLEKPGMKLDLGGIAKGYAADRAIDAMGAMGVSSALVDASGDIVIGEPPPHAIGWRVGVSTGFADEAPTEFALHNCAIATSGSAYQRVSVDSVEYSHIVSPSTGRADGEHISACVIASDSESAGAIADAWATAACVIGNDGSALHTLSPVDALRVNSMEVVCERSDGSIERFDMPVSQ